MAVTNERFFILTPTPTDTFIQDGNKKWPVYLDASGKQMKWSGEFAIPAIGSRVFIKMNRIGWAVVKGYFESHGFVGVMTLPENPPKWLVEQNKRDSKNRVRPQWMREGIGCEFGAELALEEPPQVGAKTYRCLEPRCGIAFDEPLQYPAGVASQLGHPTDCPRCGSSRIAKGVGLAKVDIW